MNSVNIVGRVGHVSGLKASVGGQLVLRLRVATDDSYVNRSGERQNRTNWHTVKVFDTAASFFSKRLEKGQLVSVQGRLVTWKPEGSADAAERQEIEAFRVERLREPELAEDSTMSGERV